MRTLERNKRTIYICTRYQDGNIVKYQEPEKIKVNYQPTNTDGDLMALGLNFPMYIRIKADIIFEEKFHAKDRVYINIIPDNDNFDGLCKDADYEVDSDPLASNNQIEVTLKRLSGKQ